MVSLTICSDLFRAWSDGVTRILKHDTHFLSTVGWSLHHLSHSLQWCSSTLKLRQWKSSTPSARAITSTVKSDSFLHLVWNSNYSTCMLSSATLHCNFTFQHPTHFPVCKWQWLQRYNNHCLANAVSLQEEDFRDYRAVIVFQSCLASVSLGALVNYSISLI